MDGRMDKFFCINEPVIGIICIANEMMMLGGLLTMWIVRYSGKSKSQNLLFQWWECMQLGLCEHQKQAGAELCQAQVKFSLIKFNFNFIWTKKVWA